ncbi:MAG: DUF1109 domain-containing protein [Nevskia sp.]
MKTDHLIDALSANLEPVAPRRVGSALASALVVGFLLAFCLMLATTGLGNDDGSIGPIRILVSKLLFALSVVVVGAIALVQAIRPGQIGWKPFTPLVLLVAAGLASATGIAFTQSAASSDSLLGGQWVACLCCIPLFTVIPFLALLWALRQGAPTQLRRTGATAGLVAGTIGAAVYAFQCPEDSLVFVAVWYSAAIALCAFVGTLLGPRLLKW